MPKPTPFSRPSIDLGGGSGRAWKTVRAETLVKGDTVADFGLVESVLLTGYMVWATNAFEAEHAWKASDEVFAFVKVP